MFCFYRENQEEIMQTPEYKVIVVGESMTGKSTFIHNMFYNTKRRGNPRSTIGVDVVAVDLHGDGPKKRANFWDCLLYTSPSPRDSNLSRMPSSA